MKVVGSLFDVGLDLNIVIKEFNKPPRLSFRYLF